MQVNFEPLVNQSAV